MPIAVEAVTPAQFAAWVRAKGGTMPTPGKAKPTVAIPQPGSDVVRRGGGRDRREHDGADAERHRRLPHLLAGRLR
ncbi:hypothetical protein AB5I41_18195 [Sphingomonas sp. MMS24-JH45]